MQVKLEDFQIDFLVKTQGNKEQPFSLSCKLQFSFVNITFNPDNFQTMMLQTPKRRVLNTYSSLPRPGHTFGSPMMGWRYADQAEVAGHTLISRRAPEGGPEYANLIPWSVDNPRVHRSQVPPPTPPRVAHYATLGRAPASKNKISKVVEFEPLFRTSYFIFHFQCQTFKDSSKLSISDSIPDILQTTNTKANLFVNELSDLEANLVDLDSPKEEKVCS